MVTYTNKTGFLRPANATFSYDAAGHRPAMTDGQGSVAYHYNDLGQLTSEDRYFNALSADPFTLSYLYNLGGELTKITNEKGNVNVGYGYDVTGRMNKVTGGGWAGVTSYVGSMEYRAFGGLKTVNYSSVDPTNKKSLAITYDAQLRVKQWNVAGVMGWNYSYQYFGEKSGRVTFADSLDDTTLDRSYEYDHVGRLVKSETGSDARSHINPTTAPPGTGDGPYSQSYTYDQWGNMKSKQGRGGADFVPYSGATYSIDNQRQGYTYDAAGNLTVASTWAYTYDVMGQQVEARQNGVLKLEQWYDGDGLRLKKNEEGEVTYYLRSSALGGQVVAEFALDTAQQPQMKRGYVYMGGQMVALQDKNASGAQQVTYVHQDPVTKSQRFTDSAGNLLPNKIDLDPWGLETQRTESPEQQPHRYTSYERDKNKSDEAMMRRYTASRNRFDQPDPYDGSYALTNPQSFNRYSYVQNDPVNFIDPSGLKETLVCPPDTVCVSTNAPYYNESSERFLWDSLNRDRLYEFFYAFGGQQDLHEKLDEIETISVLGDILTLLQDTNCRNFVEATINRAGEITGVDPYKTDIASMFLEVSGMGKLFKRSVGSSGLSFGSIPEKNVSVTFNLAPLGSPANQNGIIGIHEMMHIASSAGNYNDYVLAQAAYDVADKQKIQKPTGLGRRPNDPMSNSNEGNLTGLIFNACGAMSTGTKR